MKLLYVLPFLVPLALGATEAGPDVLKFEDGTVWQTIEKSEGEKHGMHRTYYRNGNIKTQIPYQHGLRHGTGTLFNTFGNRVREITYAEGEFHGSLREFHQTSSNGDGPLKKIIEYRDGKKHGWERHYAAFGNTVKDNTQTGKLLLERHFKDGVLDGLARSYAKDKSRSGRIEDGLREEIGFVDGLKQGPALKFEQNQCIEKNYKNNELHGEFRRYYRSVFTKKCGTLTYKKNYKNGKLHGKQYFFDDDEKLEQITRYKDGKQHGADETFNNKGYRTSIAHYDNDKKHGIEEHSRLDSKIFTLSRVNYVEGKRQGKLIAVQHHFSYGYTLPAGKNHEDFAVPLRQEFYLDDKRHGEYTSFFNNGQINVRAFYKGGNLDGEYKSHFENGQLKTHAFYQNGKLHGPYRSFNNKGRPHKSAEYVNGVYNGLVAEYDKWGWPKYFIMYKNGIRDGEFRSFGKRITILKRGYFSEDKLIGNYYNYHEKTRQLKGHRDLDSGISRYYYPDGTLEAEVIRENGVFIKGVRFDAMGNKLPSDNERDYAYKYR